MNGAALYIKRSPMLTIIQCRLVYSIRTDQGTCYKYLKKTGGNGTYVTDETYSQHMELFKRLGKRVNRKTTNRVFEKWQKIA